MNSALFRAQFRSLPVLARAMGAFGAGGSLSAIALLLVGCTAVPEAGGADNAALGRVGMSLTVAPGIELSRLDWTVQDASQGLIVSSSSTGQAPWNGGSAGSVEFVIGGIPAGGPYTIALNGATSEGDGCSGISSPFDVIRGVTSAATVNVKCGIPGAGTPTAVDSGSLSVVGQISTESGSSVNCPAIEAFSVNPTQITAKGTAQLKLRTVGPAPERVVWSTTAGSISAPNAAETVLKCGTYRGDLVVTATLEAGAACVGVAHTSQSVAVTCEAAAPETPPAPESDPQASCAANAECAGYQCVNSVCTGYAATCAELAQRGAPPGYYALDTDGSGPNRPFTTYCQTSSANLAPVGLCQSAMGAPPACKSFVGAVGYDIGSVDFSGKMEYLGVFEIGGQSVVATMEAIELADGTIVSAHHGERLVRRYRKDGELSYWQTGIVAPYGIIQLFDGSVLVSGAHGARSFDLSGSPLQTFTSATSILSAQTQSGRIWVPAQTLGTVYRYAPEGSSVGDIALPGFLPYLGTVLNLSDGRTLVLATGNVHERGAIPGAIYVYGVDGSPVTLASAPTGMTLRPDGALTRPDFSHTLGAVQLPNGQIVIANLASQTLTRLDSQLNYVDSLSLSTACSGGACSPTGLSLDHRGRLMVSSAADGKLRVITFPGCSDGKRNFSEADIDCGGTCSVRCAAGGTCNVNSDCASGNCESGFCAK